MLGVVDCAEVGQYGVKVGLGGDNITCLPSLPKKFRVYEPRV